MLMNPPEQCSGDRKSTRLNSSHTVMSYAVFCLKKKKVSAAGVVVSGERLLRPELSLAPPTLTSPRVLAFFLFNDPATTEIYTLSLHDALPISPPGRSKNRSSTSRADSRLYGSAWRD